MKPTVSVVVPIYNVEPYLDKCIQSIVDQTYKNLEIILVDDGSPDNCPAKCDEWATKDHRITVIHKKNAGLGMARNTGIDTATGDFICFIDSDDYIDITTIEKCVSKALQSNAQVALVGMVNVDDKGTFLQSVNFNIPTTYNTNEEVVNHFLPRIIAHDWRNGQPHNYPLSSCTGIFSLSLIKENQIRFLSEREIFSEDSYFLLQLYAVAKTVVLIPEALYFHFINTKSLSMTYRTDSFQKNNYFFEKSQQLVKELNYPQEIAIRVTMLYHGFTVATLKKIMACDLPRNQRKQLICEILKDSIFRKTLDTQVLKREKKQMQILMYLAKYKFYNICCFLLVLKNN